MAILIFAPPAVFTDTTNGIDRYMAVASVTFRAFIIAILGAADLAAAIGVLQLKGWGGSCRPFSPPWGCCCSRSERSSAD